MPQIWLTYEELGLFARRDGASARQAAIRLGWDRRRCRDGQTRIKLPPNATLLYLQSCMPAGDEARAPGRTTDGLAEEMAGAFLAAIGGPRRPEPAHLKLTAA